jgi:predicted nucleotidyltransferase
MMSNVDSTSIQIDDRLLADFCRRHHIAKLALFGSVLREEFSDDSDVDVLVEFEPGFVPGLAFFGMQDELSAILQRPVDLHTPKSLSRYFRELVESSADVRYPRT